MKRVQWYLRGHFSIVDLLRLEAVDRHYGQYAPPLDNHAGRGLLDILVENTGRVKDGKALPGQRAGLLTVVTGGGQPVASRDN
jgi:hypothetical protein